MLLHSPELPAAMWPVVFRSDEGRRACELRELVAKPFAQRPILFTQQDLRHNNRVKKARHSGLCRWFRRRHRAGREFLVFLKLGSVRGPPKRPRAKVARGTADA